MHAKLKWLVNNRIALAALIVATVSYVLFCVLISMNEWHTTPLSGAFLAIHALALNEVGVQYGKFAIADGSADPVWRLIGTHGRFMVAMQVAAFGLTALFFDGVPPAAAVVLLAIGLMAGFMSMGLNKPKK